MRNEFNELVETMKRWDLFQNGDEVDMALTNLSNKIGEVEKRMECAVRSSKEINKAIAPYQDSVDNGTPFTMSVAHWDAINNCANDIDISLDLGDDMCVVDNWYGLFAPKKEVEPIAVGNIEYDFPEEVYTIGNADNTEIIGDIYDSVFIAMIDLGVIINEGDDRFPKGNGKANYVVRDNIFINLIKEKQIDLSKVPIKREVFFEFGSSWGEISCDREGNVISVRPIGSNDDEENYLYDIVKFDLESYFKFCESKNFTHGESADILSVGFWKKDGTFTPPDAEWLKNMYGDKENTTDPSKHEIVNNIISQLKSIEVDGETMEYILEQVGMKEQIFSQLFERQG